MQWHEWHSILTGVQSYMHAHPAQIKFALLCVAAVCTFEPLPYHLWYSEPKHGSHDPRFHRLAAWFGGILLFVYMFAVVSMLVGASAFTAIAALTSIIVLYVASLARLIVRCQHLERAAKPKV